MISAIEHFNRGGPVMYLILYCSLVALTFTIERLFHFSRAAADVKSLMQDVKELFSEGLIYKAMARCDETHGPVARVLKTVVKNHEKGSVELKEAVEAAALDEIPRLERHLSILATIANISTLLGLLGTIIGMIVTFQSIAAQASGVVNVNVLASGIWQAMITTAAGLAVAIPTVIVYAYLTSRVRAFSTSMEQASTEMINYVLHIRKGGGDAV